VLRQKWGNELPAKAGTPYSTALSGEAVMRFAYNILFVLFFWLSAPYYFWKMWRRGNWRAGLGQRFGRYSPELKTALGKRPVVWLHAVSVGEVGVCWQLIRALEPHLSAFQILVSTTTSTGMAELQRLLPAHIQRIYYPADFAGGVRRAMKAIQPRVIILVEAELWPNFLNQAIAARCPLFLANARFSVRSTRNYGFFGFFFKPIFARFSGVGCQQAEDASRMIELGFRPEAVHLTGNLKFDAAQPGAGSGPDVPALLRHVGVGPKAMILVAGSTHAGEEALLADVFLRLRRRFPNLFLVLVPRHFERTKEVAWELKSRGVKYVLRSIIPEGKAAAPGECECLLVNSTGELKYFYEQATVVFVGKSLTAQGGQNPIEPAALGKPVVLGPNMQNFASVTRAFLGSQAVVQVQNASELESALADLLGNADRRAELGERARQVVQQNLGATERTVKFIMEGIYPPAG
jgi:3-deoxy-D-manno-octulosonic-acid transferase